MVEDHLLCDDLGDHRDGRVGWVPEVDFGLGDGLVRLNDHVHDFEGVDDVLLGLSF